MGGNFEFQVQDSFLEYFFLEIGNLKRSHFLKKKPLVISKNLKILSLLPRISKAFLDHQFNFFLRVGQNNFGNKVTVPLLQNVFHPIVHTGLISFVCGKHKSKFECIRSKRPSNCRDNQYSNKSYLITILGIGLGILFMPKHSSKEVNCIAKGFKETP